MQRKQFLFNIFILTIYCASTAQSAFQCEDWLQTTDTVTFNSSEKIVIEGSENEFVAILLNPKLFSMGEESSLIIIDAISTTPLVEFSAADLGSLPELYVFSFTADVSIYFSVEEENVTATIDYVILNQDALRANSTLVESDWIVSNGNDDCPVINYRQTWLVSPGKDNVVHYFFSNLTIDDTMGDFLAIGTGDEIFAKSPAMMISGNRSEFFDVDVYGSITYVHLFSKYFTSTMGFALFFNTSLFVPPTDEPPTTVAPPAILNATVPYESSFGDKYDFISNFTSVIDKYATSFCEGKKHTFEVNLTVDVTEVVEAGYCMVIVYFIDIYNGSCQGNKSFTLDTYNQMWGNFSSNIIDDFGHEVGNSCPADSWTWVIAVIIVMVAAILLTVVVALNRKDYLYKRLRQSDPIDMIQETKNEAREFDENTSSSSTSNHDLIFRNLNNASDIRLRSLGKSNPLFQDDEDSTPSFDAPKTSLNIQHQSPDNDVSYPQDSMLPIGFENLYEELRPHKI